MKIERNISLTTLLEHIEQAYFTILGITSIAEVEKQKNITYDKLLFLSKKEEIFQKMKENTLSQIEMHILGDIIFEGFILKELFDTGGEISTLGSIQQIQGDLLNQSNSIEDYMFSKIIQAYYSYENPNIPLIDLAYQIDSNEKVCDFKIEDENGGFELIECKKIHNNKDSPTEDDLVRKIESKISEAKKQLLSTEKILGKDAKCKHIAIDISNYSDQGIEYLADKDVHFSGFQKSELQQVFSRLQGKKIQNIDGVSIFWKTAIYKNSLIIGQIYQSEYIAFLEKIPESIFQGFTLEIYPEETDTQYIKEVRISTEAKSIDWIITSRHNIADTKNFFGALG